MSTPRELNVIFTILVRVDRDDEEMKRYENE